MKNFFALGAAVAIFACAAPAMAQEADHNGGFTFGVVSGYDHVTASAQGAKDSKDGVLYGAIVGYDQDLGQATVGVEAEIDGSSVKDSLGYESLKAGRDIYVGARAAYVITQQVSVYAKAGYTNARIRYDYNDGEVAYRYAFNTDGFRLGAGLEVAVSKPILARIEYRYSDYGHTYVANVDTGISARRQQVVAALVTRF